MTDKLEITLHIASEAPAQEFRQDWPAIATERVERLDAMDHCAGANLEHTRLALHTAERAIRERPSTVWNGHLMYIDAGACNGSDCPFDFTGHRTLDTNLTTACQHHVRDNRRGMREAPHHLVGGGRKPHRWLHDEANEPAVRIDKCRTEAFAMLPEKTDRDRDSLLDEAIDARAAKDRRKASAGPKTSAPRR